MRSAPLSALILFAAASRVLFARGDGSFGLKNPLENAGVANPNAVEAGDFNGDGKLDLAIANPSALYTVLQDPGNREVWRKLPSGQPADGFAIARSSLPS